MSGPSTSPPVVPLPGPAAWCLAGEQPAVPRVSVRVSLSMPTYVCLLPFSISEHSAPPLSSSPPASTLRSLFSTVTFPKALQCLNITVLSDEQCKKAYPNQVDNTMFCAGDQAGRDSCQVRLETSPFIQLIHTETTYVPGTLLCPGDPVMIKSVRPSVPTELIFWSNAFK